MPEELIQIILFVGIGATLWLISQRFSMSIYPLQKVERYDYWFIFLSVAMVLLYDSTIVTSLDSAFNESHETIPAIRNYFSTWPVALQILIYLLISDCMTYWTHRALHRGILWRSHALHHSPVSLNWLSGMRGSPVHYILTLTPEILVANMFLAPDWMTATIACIGIFNQHFIHTNIHIPYAKQIEYIFVTPRMHFVHHHPNLPYTDSNYGFIFSLWDRLFGTYTDADTVTTKGLTGIDYVATKWEMFWGLRPKNRA